MYANNSGAAVTAFKQAEKRYQLHKQEQFRHRHGRRQRRGYLVKPLDLSGVLDLNADEPFAGVTRHSVPSCLPPVAAAFSLVSHPGLLVVRGALAPDVQRQLIRDALTLFIEPPNHTTLTKEYPNSFPGLWAAVQQGLSLRATGGQPGAAAAPAAGPQQPAARASDAQPAGLATPGSFPSSSLEASPWVTGGAGPNAATLLRKLRWATLGPPYDWTHRKYLSDAPHTPLPQQLRQLALTLADLALQVWPARNCARVLGANHQPPDPGIQDSQAAGQHLGSQPPVVDNPSPRSFNPDAALVNFYYEGDTLNGHIDDAEMSLDQPLVSLSLGCSAVFLMGHASKQQPPTALLLRSGDALVLSGGARRCYHGVPRVLTDVHLPDHLLCGCAGDQATSAAGSGNGARDCFCPFSRHMQGCRINISIRDIH